MAVKNYQVLLNSEDILKFDKIAKSKERSRSFILREIIKKFLEEAKLK